MRIFAFSMIFSGKIWESGQRYDLILKVWGLNKEDGSSIIKSTLKRIKQ